MRIRFLRTEGFRLSAIYAGVFALSVVVLGVFRAGDHQSGPARPDRAFSASDIAAIRNGYASEGVPEAREVINQLMAGPGRPISTCCSKTARLVDGNLPAMPERIGTVDIAASPVTGNHEVLGVGAFLAPGLYVFSGSDTDRLRAVQAHILNVMLVCSRRRCCWRWRAAPWSAAVSCAAPTPWPRPAATSWMAI